MPFVATSGRDANPQDTDATQHVDIVQVNEADLTAATTATAAAVSPTSATRYEIEVAIVQFRRSVDDLIFHQVFPHALTNADLLRSANWSECFMIFLDDGGFNANLITANKLITSIFELSIRHLLIVLRISLRLRVHVSVATAYSSLIHARSRMVRVLISRLFAPHQ